jgi:hypothetical protein
VRFAGVVYVLHAFQKKAKRASLRRGKISTLLNRACVMLNCITARAPRAKGIIHDET